MVPGFLLYQYLLQSSPAYAGFLLIYRDMIPIYAAILKRRIQESANRLIHLIVSVHRTDGTNQILIDLFRLPLFGVICSLPRYIIYTVKKNDRKLFALRLLLSNHLIEGFKKWSPEYKNAEGDYKEAVRDQLRYVWLSTVPESEKPINKNNLTFEANGDDEPTAKVRLDGREALWHARNRGEDGICSGDDFTRTQRQRDVIGVIINKLKNSDLATIQSAIYELGPLITTNIKATQMISLASDASKYLKYEMVSESAPNVKEFGSSFTFSSDEHPIYINGYFSSVILVHNWNEYRYQIWRFLYEEQVQYR